MIIRTYSCTECDTVFDVEMESGNDPDPDCPNCTKVLQWIPGEFAITGHKSRAIDYTQKVIEEDFGMSNLNDRNREGDVAYKAPPVPTTAEREAVEREVREYAAQAVTPVPIPEQNAPGGQAVGFWGNPGPGQIAARPIPASEMIAGAKSGPAADVNPMSMLQEGIKSGHLPRKERIVARWKP
jgi:hypothetical protein